MKPCPCYVALLRGINVGGKNVIKMEALRKSFAGLGFTAVQTLIASGNVVFCGPRMSSRKLEARIEDALSREHRYEPRVVVRSFEEYQRMLQAMPARWGANRSRRYYVMFLRHAIDRASVLDELEINDEVEDLRYVPGALLWSARRDALGRSRVRNVMGSRLYQDMTIRNFNTARKTFELMRERAVPATVEA